MLFRSEVRQLKDEYLIPFNHLLKDYVNTHPNDGIHATSTALANVYDKVFARFDCLDSTNERAPYDISSGYVFDKIKTALDGMRHEVAAEMILDAAGYTYDYNVTTQEDARGSDLFVYLESGWEGIDVKASQSGVQRSQGQGHASRAVSTGLGWGDFTGLNGTGKETLSIPFATAELKAPYFIDSIYEMTARVEAEAQARARRTGHHTLKRMR